MRRGDREADGARLLSECSVMEPGVRIPPSPPFLVQPDLFGDSKRSGRCAPPRFCCYLMGQTMVRILSTIICMALLFIGLGCREQQQGQPEAESAPVKEIVHAPAPQVLEIVVPGAVEGMWESVKLAVRDRQNGNEDIFSVDIGGSFLLPEEKLRVTVETFLPAFIMDGKKITSGSNQATNPAVRITIQQEESAIFDGWLFGLYPDTHAFQHPRYNFTLLSYKPAE